MNRDYLVLSTTVTDEIYFNDGTKIERIIGGAGSYALSGMKIWSDDVLIVTGVGEDYLDMYKHWYLKNNISTDGLIVKDKHTPHNTIRYFEDGERSETPRYGLDHYKKIEGTIEDLEKFCTTSKGVYIFKNANEKFWEDALKSKQKYSYKLMWEIGSDATIPKNLELIKEIAKEVDILSINKSEVLSMFDTEDFEESVKELLSWNIPLITLRVGSKGCYALFDNNYVLVPSIKNANVVDVTGGGNSFSGGTLVGYCETNDPILAIKMGNISASFCISQYGVPEIIDSNLRNRANSLLKEI